MCDKTQKKDRFKAIDLMFIAGAVAIMCAGIVVEKNSIATKEDTMLILERASVASSHSAPKEITLKSTFFSSRNPFVLNLQQDGDERYYTIVNVDSDLCKELNIMQRRKSGMKLSVDFLKKVLNECENGSVVELKNPKVKLISGD